MRGVAMSNNEQLVTFSANFAKQYIWQKLYRQKFYSGGPILMSAMAGIDQALWDIAGKTLGVPCHRMMGGSVRDRLKAYRWCGGDEASPEESAAEAKKVLSESNYKQLKMNACPRMGYVDTEQAVDAAAARFEAVRAAVGPDVGIGLDFHGRVKLPVAKKLMAALAPYSPLFFEEVLVRGQNPALASNIKGHTAVPLATGERMYTIEEFRDLFETRAIDIIQPDCSHAGGISQMLTIARMAEAYEVAFAPHCPLGPIALAACLQVDACAVNFVFQETSLGIHYNEEGGMDLLGYVSNKDVFDVDTEGYIATPTLPGLGIIIDEAAVRAASLIGHTWKDREWTLKVLHVYELCDCVPPVAQHNSITPRHAAHINTPQHAALRHSTAHHSAPHHAMAQHTTTQHTTTQHTNTPQHNMIRCNTTQLACALAMFVQCNETWCVIFFCCAFYFCRTALRLRGDSDVD
jgi:galactonate dehydratase